MTKQQKLNFIKVTGQYLIWKNHKPLWTMTPEYKNIVDEETNKVLNQMKK